MSHTKEQLVVNEFQIISFLTRSHIIRNTSRESIIFKFQRWTYSPSR